MEFIHRWLPQPDATRTLLMLHGTGGNEDDLVSLGTALDPTANILSPRGRINEQGMNRFFRRFGEGVFDEESIRTEAAALAEFVSKSAQSYGFDPATVTAVGFSNGANIGAALFLLHPEILSAGVLIRAMVPLRPPEAPDLAGKRILIASGESDPIVPKHDVDELARMLREAGAEVDHQWIPTGHNLTRGEITYAQQWLRAQ